MRPMLTDLLWVVETHGGDAFIGQLLIEADQVTVYSGFVGRPPVIPLSEVAEMVVAAEHPDVEVADA